MTTSSTVGQKLWNYCTVLRDAGLSYGDYLEQLTYLIFLKMMHERSQPPYTLLPDYQPPPIPQGYDWPSLLSRDGDELEAHYRRTLETLARQPGTLGVIFGKAQNRIQEPAMLTRLINDLIDSENWMALSADVKGDAYESLLERNAQDVKTGAGQYFTPRPLIQAIVEVMRPDPDSTICDPACGTGGFLLAAHDYIVDRYPSMDQGQLEHLRDHDPQAVRRTLSLSDGPHPRRPVSSGDDAVAFCGSAPTRYPLPHTADAPARPLTVPPPAHGICLHRSFLRPDATRHSSAGYAHGSACMQRSAREKPLPLN